jgi:IclR family acetate operon transcriptional repressor
MGDMNPDRAESEGTPQTRIRSVSRGIRILLAIAASDQGLTVKDIAEKFGLSSPTAYHIVNTLLHEGIVIKDERRRYLLGPSASIVSEGYARTNPMPERYLSAIQKLADESGETAYLSAWRNGAIAVLSTTEGSHAVRVAGLNTGYADNVHARASGKLLLAFAPDALRDAALDRMSLNRLTQHTIVERSVLLEEFGAIREQDLAFDRQEFQEGVQCISAPIREGEIVVASLTLSCPADRFTSREADLIAMLRAASKEVSRD